MYLLYYEVDQDPPFGFCVQICNGLSTPVWPREVSNCPWSITTPTPSWPCSQVRLWISLSLQSKAALLVSPGWSHETRGENFISMLTWRLAFWVRVHPFSSHNPRSFVTGTSYSWTLEGKAGKPWGPVWLPGLHLLQVWTYNNLSRSQMGSCFFCGGVELPAHFST